MSNGPISCDCGFVWDGVTLSESISGINDAVSEFINVIEQAGEMALVRPELDRWNIVEYAAHLRDVFISSRERLIVASVQEMPTGQPIFRDERVNMGFYSLDSLDDSADELAFAAGLLSKTIATLPEGFEKRKFIFSPMLPAEVSIRWQAAQALHEARHHLDDVKRNLELLS